MFIVTKFSTFKNSVSIIDVGEESGAFSFHVAYMALINDCDEYIKEPLKYSVKNISKNRIEVTIKGILSNYLGFIYEIHDTDETEDKTEE